MEEQEFWLRLEYRICGELAGMPENWQRRLWCDGLVPEHYDLDSKSPVISGDVYLFDHKDPLKWRFLLLLPQRYTSSENVVWGALLPPENVTRWLALDPHRRLMEIEPAAATPDLEQSPN